jgi:hypothetical protein
MRFKKGLAPLVAGLLLLSFAVAIGVTVMNFGRAQVELEAECPISIDLEFSQPACLQSEQIQFTVENGVNVKLEGLLVNIIGTDKAETFDLSAKVERAGTYQGHIPFSGEIRQLKITPKILFYDQEQICTKKALTVENIANC